MTNTRPCDFRTFILAAGEGRRLKPYTDHVPKPMVEVAGKPILAHMFDHLERDKIRHVTMNSFYKPEVIRDFANAYQGAIDITLSEETELLDTGLGMKRALETMGGNPFFAINGDAFWGDGENGSVLEKLAEAWRPENMDILLLLQPVDQMTLTTGVGDYQINDKGQAVRQKDQSGNYMFAGIRICQPEIFKDTPETPFSFLELMDKAESEGRLYAVVHDGAWHHISTPIDLERVNEAYAQNKQKEALG